MVRVGDDGNAVKGSEINLSAKAVEAYDTDLPFLESISDFTLDNDGDINNGADKLVALINSIKECKKSEGEYENH
ncbi:MAG: hypothetical protein LBU32_11280 [Clostridiales bacterium]|nr:hypothetical protein [Clostridiales bacterium]